MEWLEIVTKLGLTGTLAFATYTLWRKLEAKDQEIRELNAARVKDLIAVAARDDH